MNILIKNATIVTVDADMTIIKSGYVGIKGNEISFVEEKKTKVVEEFVVDKTIDANGGIVMPGLVNCHVHTPMTILRCFGDDLPLNEWLFDKIIPTEEKFSHEDIYWGVMLGIAEQIKCGVTCFADMYEPCETLLDMVTQTHIRANISGPLANTGSEDEYNEYVEHIKKHNNSRDGLIKEYAIIHSIYTYSEEKIKNRVRAAKEANTGIHIHISEAQFEIDTVNEQYKMSPVEKLNEWGVFDVPTIAAHCVHLTDNDYKILKEKNVSVVHCPTSNLKLASGIANVPKLLNEGINVSIGTDGTSSNNNLNMIEEMHIASLLHKGHYMDPLAVSAKEIVKMATVNGAKAAGFGDLVGSIEVGKKADIIIINTDKAHLTPLNDVLSALAYSVQGSDVNTVIVNGKVLMEDRKLLHMDEFKIKNEVNKIASKLFKI